MTNCPSCSGLVEEHQKFCGICGRESDSSVQSPPTNQPIEDAGTKSAGWSLLRVAVLLSIGYVLIDVAFSYVLVPRYAFYSAVTIVGILVLSKLRTVSTKAAIVLVLVVAMCSMVDDLVVWPTAVVTLGFGYSSGIDFDPLRIVAYIGSVGIAFLVLSVFRVDYRNFLFRFSPLSSSVGRFVVVLALLFTPVYLVIRTTQGSFHYQIAQTQSEVLGNGGSTDGGDSGGGTPVESALSICSSNLDSWVQFFRSNTYSGSNSFLFTLRNAGLLYATGGIGGDIGEWIRESALGQTNVSSSNECEIYLNQGVDLSWITSAP